MTMLVRPFVASDTDRLRTICQQTAIERPFLPYLDEPRFACAFYLDPYLQLEGESCFVAEIGQEIVGYLVGARDSVLFERQLDSHLRRRLAGLLRLHFEGTVRGRYRNALSHRLLARAYLRLILGRPRETSHLERFVDLSRYPAHCHLQVAPEARAKRAGLALMLQFHKYLKASGVPGQYSSVAEEVGREGYSRMLLAMRFRVVHESTFTRHENPALIHPGAWRERILVREF